MIRSLRDEAGLSMDGFAVQAQAQYAGGDPDRWRTHAERWRDLGATHLAIATHNAGPTDADGHLRGWPSTSTRCGERTAVWAGSVPPGLGARADRGDLASPADERGRPLTARAGDRRRRQGRRAQRGHPAPRAAARRRRARAGRRGGVRARRGRAPARRRRPTRRAQPAGRPGRDAPPPPDRRPAPPDPRLRLAVAARQHRRGRPPRAPAPLPPRPRVAPAARQRGGDARPPRRRRRRRTSTSGSSSTSSSSSRSSPPTPPRCAARPCSTSTARSLAC